MNVRVCRVHVGESCRVLQEVVCQWFQNFSGLVQCAGIKILRDSLAVTLLHATVASNYLTTYSAYLCLHFVIVYAS